MTSDPRDAPSPVSSGSGRVVARATVVVAALTLASRALGFLRDTALADKFGATRQTDLYNVATILPSTVFGVIAIAITAAMIPVLASLKVHEGQEAAVRLTRKLSGLILASFVAMFPALWVLAPLLSRVLAPGFTPAELAKCVALTRVMLPAILFTNLVAWGTGLLNAEQEFTVPAAAVLPQNIVIIASIVVGGSSGWGIMAVAWGTVLGSMVAFLPMLPSIRRVIGSWRPSLDLGSDIRAVIRDFGPILGTVVAPSLLTIVDRIIASHLAAGAITTLAYASRLQNFAYGIMAAALGTVLYPNLARHFGLRDLGGFRRLFDAGFGLVTFLTVPIMAAFLLMPSPLVAVLFRHGAFTAADEAVTADALRMLGIGTLALAWIDYLTRGLFAARDAIGPAIGAAVLMGVKVVLSLWLVGPLGETGLALASGLAWCGGAAFLLLRFRRRLGPLEGRRHLRNGGRAAAAAAVSVFLARSAYFAMVQHTGHPGTVLDALFLGGSLLTATAIYLVLCYVAKVDEVRPALEIGQALLRRL